MEVGQEFWTLRDDRYQPELKEFSRCFRALKEEDYPQPHMLSVPKTVTLSTIGSPYGRGQLPKTKAKIETEVVSVDSIGGLAFEKRRVTSVREYTISY